MTKEEDFFKENFPEYVTEKGEFLSPYWDLFSAGVICANFELNNKIAELEAQIEKMKQDLDRARENANRQEQWEIYSVLNDIYNNNFEVITSVSN